MCNDPNIGLVTVIDWVRVGILWRQAIVDAEHRNAKLDSPLSCVVLMCTRVLTNETTSVEVYHCLIEVLLVCSRDWLVVHKSDLNVSVRIVINITFMVCDVTLGLIYNILSSLSNHELIKLFIGHVIVG